MQDREGQGEKESQQEKTGSNRGRSDMLPYTSQKEKKQIIHPSFSLTLGEDKFNFQGKVRSNIET